MTREEMIKALNEIIECPIGLKAWYILALEMAIQALSQEPRDDAEQIDYHDDFETASRKIHDYEERQKQNDKKCCSDCQLIGTDSCYMVCGGSKSLYKPKQKLEPCTDNPQPCDDAISRIEVMNVISDFVALEKYIDKHNHITFEPLEQMINSLPSVMQKSGHWIIDSWLWSCDKCGNTYHKDNARTFKFCPNCGVRMESEK